MVRKNGNHEDDYRPPSQSTTRHRPRIWAQHQSRSLRKAVLTTRKKKEETEAAVEADTLNIPYYEDFRSHVGGVRAYMEGKCDDEGGEDDEDDENDEAGLPREPIFESQWTSTEKNAFFRALSTSSRLRPDLIAASIKTKTIFEVCTYLRALEDGAAELKAAQITSDSESSSGSEDEDANAEEDGEDNTTAVAGQTRKRRIREYESDGQKFYRRRNQLEQDALERRTHYPFAHEMSIPWTKHEDRLSRVVCGLDDEQGGYIPPRLSATTEKGKATESGEARTSDLYFVNTQLQILEGILRDWEDAQADLTAHAPSPHPKSRSASLSNSINAQRRSSVASTSKSKDHGYDEASNSGVEDTQKDEGSDEEEEEEPRIDMQQMTPAARRRLQKRLYMRKQRALKQGGEAAVTAVDMKTIRLRRGRKPKAGSATTAVTGEKRKRASTLEDSGEDDNVDEGDDDDGEALRSKTRKGEQYRFKSQFAAAGIDGDIIAKEGLAFFNLSALGKMMNLFTSGYRDRLVQGRAAISADLIRILLHVVTEFVAEVIHRSVVISESQTTMRSKSKVWRESSNDSVSVESVKMALQMIGRCLEDRKTYLRRILDREELQSKDLEPPRTKGTRKENDNRSNTEKGKGKAKSTTTPTDSIIVSTSIPVPTTSNGLPRESVCRSIYKPFVHLPREYRPPPKRKRINYLAPATTHHSTSEDQSLRNTSDLGESDLNDEEEEEEIDEIDCDDPILPLLPDSAEDKEYQREMVEEAGLDAEDMKETREFEQEAWIRTLVA